MAINREALHKWVDEQCDRIEGTPIPPDLEALGTGEKLTAEEVLLLWHAAGIASQVGMHLAMKPQQFIPGCPEQDAEDEAAEVAEEVKA